MTPYEIRAKNQLYQVNFDQKSHDPVTKPIKKSLDPVEKLTKKSPDPMAKPVEKSHDTVEKPGKKVMIPYAFRHTRILVNIGHSLTSRWNL